MGLSGCSGLDSGVDRVDVSADRSLFHERFPGDPWRGLTDRDSGIKMSDFVLGDLGVWGQLTELI